MAGRPWGVLVVLHTGCRWRDLPPELGGGREHTARRMRHRQEAGVWEKLHQRAPDEL
ncbi:transposase [Kocuria sp. U4B]